MYGGNQLEFFKKNKRKSNFFFKDFFILNIEFRLSAWKVLCRKRIIFTSCLSTNFSINYTHQNFQNSQLNHPQSINNTNIMKPRFQWNY
jgi:hypothetical protein